MKKRWETLLSLLTALVMVTAAGCGDDSDDDETEAGPGEETEESVIPASCEGEGDTGDSEDGAEDSEEGEDGEDDTATGTDTGGELTPITVGILPIADLAPLYYGIDEGLFEDEGLEVTTEIGQGGAAMMSSVMTGDFDYAFGNYVSVMLARQNGVGAQIASHIVNGADTPDRGTNALLVDPDKIESIEDLAGKTFAVTTLDNVAEVNIRTTLIRNGVDDSGIDFREVLFPEMNALVESGEIDAAWTAEPFITMGEAAGLVNLVDPMYETTPSMPLAGLFANEEWLDGNAEVADAFDRAMQRSLEASGDDEAMQAAIVDHTDTTAEQVTGLALANWDPELNLTKLGCVGELSVLYEILEEEPEFDELIWAPEE